MKIASTLIVSIALLLVGTAVPASADHIPGPRLAWAGEVAPFDRGRAAGWALDNATKKQPYKKSCTWFVSQALWAGGMREDDTWNRRGSRGFLPGRKVSGTLAATSVEHLIGYLSRQYPFSQKIDLDFTVLAIPQASAGDIIVYDWNDDGKPDHMALVVSWDHAGHPEVAQWGTLQNPAAHSRRVWTRSASSEHWIQEKQPSARAYLFHIDTRVPIRF